MRPRFTIVDSLAKGIVPEFRMVSQTSANVAIGAYRAVVNTALGMS